MPQNPWQPPAPPPAYNNPAYPPGSQFIPSQPVQYAHAMQPNNGVGMAGGIVGIIAAALLWFPYIGLVLGVIGVALGGVGLSRANRLGGAGKGMSITGIVCGGIALIINILFIAAIATAFSVQVR
jgi:hypothetical protein